MTVTCPRGAHDVDAYRAAHWQCPVCKVQVTACFMCFPAGEAYEYVDDGRKGHACETQKPKLELVPLKVDLLCGVCGAKDVRLYRRYQTVVEHQELFCTACALKHQKQAAPDLPSAHTIGWLVAAVPTPDGESFWGFTSVPDDGVAWWNALPVEGAAKP